MSLQTAGSLALLTLYLLIVRSLCWRRYNALHKKYTGKKSTLTPEEAQEIVQLVFEWDMPILSEYSLAFALFKTYAIPTISSLLLTTGQLSIPATVARLYADTEILIATWMVCPLAGKLVDTKPEAPADDPRASLALARVNWLHGKYKISNEDFLYTLGLFMFEPAKWAKQYGWRPHSDLECHASFVYWSEIGRKMNITNIPPTAEAFQAWIEEYEAEHILPAESNRDVATYTTNELLFPVPHALGIRAFAEGFTRAMLDKPTRIAMMYLWMSLDSISAVLRLVQREFTGNRPPQHKYAPAVIQSLLNIVAFVQKHLLLPRRKPAAAVKSELPPLVRTEGGEIAPRLYPKFPTGGPRCRGTNPQAERRLDIFEIAYRCYSTGMMMYPSRSIGLAGMVCMKWVHFPSSKAATMKLCGWRRQFKDARLRMRGVRRERRRSKEAISVPSYLLCVVIAKRCTIRGDCNFELAVPYHVGPSTPIVLYSDFDSSPLGDLEGKLPIWRSDCLKEMIMITDRDQLTYQRPRQISYIVRAAAILSNNGCCGRLLSSLPDSTEGALPQELIDYIVSLVDDTRTLKLCALAGSVLRATSQRRLFAELTIMPSSISSAEENPPLTPTNLLEMLLRSPHIQTYIRSLTLRLSDESPYRAVWIDDPLLPSILGKFDNLTSLTMAKIITGVTNPTLYWAMLPRTFQHAVEGLLTLPSLETLRIQQLFFAHTKELVGLVLRATSLKELQSWRVWVQGNDDHPAQSLSLGLSVSRLSVDWIAPDLVEALAYIVNPDNLRYIHALFNNDTEADNLQQLLGTVGEKLEHLHLHLQCTQHRPLDACPDIRNLSNLQTLELTLVLPSQYLPIVPTTGTHYEIWLLRMMQIVSRADERLGIRRIIINIQLQTPHEADFSFVSRLQPLDLLFMQSFPVLQELVVRLGIDPDVRFHDMPAVGANARWRMRGEVEVRGAFTVLSEKGMVNMVTVEVL